MEADGFERCSELVKVFSKEVADMLLSSNRARFSYQTMGGQRREFMLCNAWSLDMAIARGDTLVIDKKVCLVERVARINDISVWLSVWVEDIS